MSNVQFPRIIDATACPITRARMELVNEGHGTLKIQHPTSIGNMQIAVGGCEAIAQHWRLILLGFDPLTLGCSSGYTKFREARYPYTNAGEKYDKRFTPR
jgi:hypothetical protein